jgi:hypothetical protein
MLSVVGEFSFCAFVAEEFDFAVRKFGGRIILEGGFLVAEVLCLCD